MPHRSCPSPTLCACPIKKVLMINCKVCKTKSSTCLGIEGVAKLAAALCEVSVPKSGSISTNPIAKAIGEEISSHYLGSPRAECAASFATPSIEWQNDLQLNVLEFLTYVSAFTSLKRLNIQKVESC